MKKRKAFQTKASPAWLSFAREYLVRFGYMKPCGHAKKQSCEHLAAALLRLQSFTRLEPTGTLTRETMKLIARPRCGVSDVHVLARSTDGDEESDPFTYSGGRWTKTSLTWVLDSQTDDTTTELSTIQRAFDTWSEHIPLTFTNTSRSDADILVGWIMGDPTNGLLAFTIQEDVPVQSRIVFDDAEVDWSNQALFFSTALHEIGHAIGLGHSGNPDAIMFFAVNSASSLHEDDIRGARSRYPTLVPSNSTDFIQVPLHATLSRFGGTETMAIDLGSPKKVLAWGEVTMADSLNRFDQDNAYAVEVYEVDGNRCPGEYHFGGDHFGSDGGPANVQTGAWVGDAQRISFRIRANRVADLEAFGVGNVMILG